MIPEDYEAEIAALLVEIADLKRVTEAQAQELEELRGGFDSVDSFKGAVRFTDIENKFVYLLARHARASNHSLFMALYGRPPEELWESKKKCYYVTACKVRRKLEKIGVALASNYKQGYSVTVDEQRFLRNGYPGVKW